MAAQSKKTGSAVTAPKGRATAARDQRGGRRRFLSPTMEWVLAVILFLVALAVLFYFLRDVRSTTGGTTLGADVASIVTPSAPPVAT